MTPITVLIPWDGCDQPWLDEALASLPIGTPFVVAENAGKHEMAQVVNEALASIDTEYTFVMGADDVATEGMLEMLYAAIGSADVAYPTMTLFWPDEEQKPEYEFRAAPFSLHMLQDRNVCGVFLAKTNALRAVGGWRNMPIEDWDLVYRLAQNGCRFVPCPEAKYRYRQHANSLSRRLQPALEEADVTIAKHHQWMLGGPRKALHALFLCGATNGTNYVRCQLPALGLPGVARDGFDPSNPFDVKATIFTHPAAAALSLFDAAAKFGPVLADVDDGYAAPGFHNALQEAARRDPGLRPLRDQWVEELPAHLEFVKRADGVVCATGMLAELYKDLNPSVYVVPNTVDPKDWPGVQPHDDLIIGWAAGKQHLPDASLVEPALRWASSLEGVRVVVIGVDPGWKFPYQHFAFTPSLQVYRDCLSLFDIGVAPVKKGGINAFKSDLKWLEYTMGGAATIASDVPCYETCHGSALMAATPSDFTKRLQDVIFDAELRRNLVEWSRERVLRERTFVMAGMQYRRILEQIGTRELAVAA